MVDTTNRPFQFDGRSFDADGGNGAGEGLTRRTNTVRAGEEPGEAWPLADPICLSTVYGFADPRLADACYRDDPPGSTYARDGLPNVRALERAVADLEGGEAAVATASGMAAIGLLFQSLLRAGDEVVIAPQAYCDTEALLVEEFARFGVRTVFADTADPAAVAAALTPRTRLVHCETIANPSMKLSDLPGLTAVVRAHGKGCLLSVDNTFGTPVLCRPLEHGVDLVVHSVTKFLGGHHDLTAGIVVGRRDLLDRVRRAGYLYGPTLGPFDAWLALRGIKTLAARMAWICAAAGEVARFLETHPAVATVRYPGLASSPQAALARRLLPDGAGGMIVVELAGGPAAAAALLRTLRLIPYAPSLGGTTTTASYPPRRPPPLGETVDANPRPPVRKPSAAVRLSIGLEHPRDLIADLSQALAALPICQVETVASLVEPVGAAG